MATYEITTRKGQTFQVEFDRPPTEADIDDAASHLSGGQADSGPGLMRSMLGSAAQGAAQNVSGVLKSIGTASAYLNRNVADLGGEFSAEDTPTFQLGQTIERGAQSVFPTNPQYAQGFWTGDVPSGLGQVAGMVATGIGGRALGANALRSSLTMGFGAEMSDAFDRARQRGDDEDTAAAKAMAYGTLATAIEGKLGAGRILKRFGIGLETTEQALEKAANTGAAKVALKEAVAGFGEEASQRLVQDAIVDGRLDFNAIAREGGAGAVVQALLGAVGHAAYRGRAKQTLEWIRDKQANGLSESEAKQSGLAPETLLELNIPVRDRIYKEPAERPITNLPLDADLRPVAEEPAPPAPRAAAVDTLGGLGETPAPAEDFNLLTYGRTQRALPEVPAAPTPLEGQPYDLSPAPSAAPPVDSATTTAGQNAPAGGNPLESSAGNREDAARPVPVPEPAQTLQAQAEQAANPQSSRAAVLVTPGADLTAAASSADKQAMSFDWDVLNEELGYEIDVWHPARDGSHDYDLMDVVNRFIDFARNAPNAKSINELVRAFASRDEASSSQISKLRKSLKDLIEQRPELNPIPKPGAEVPQVSTPRRKGAKALVPVETAQGTALVNPAKADPQAVKAQLDAGGGGTALGMSTEAKPQGGAAVLQTKDAQGRVVQDEVVTKETLPAAQAAARAAVPGGTSELKAAEQVIAERQSSTQRRKGAKAQKVEAEKAAPQTTSGEQGLTPMMAQYRRIKEQLVKEGHTNTLLAFRLGDFYEFFFEDAGIAANALKIAKTRRGIVDMAGIPFHAAERYFANLTKQGHKVAVVDLSETTKPGQLAERKVTEIRKPAETPAEAVGKVKEHLQDVKAEAPTPAAAMRGQKEVKSELVARLEAAIEKAQTPTDQQKSLLDNRPQFVKYQDFLDENSGASKREQQLTASHKAQVENARIQREWNEEIKRTGLEKVTIRIPGDGEFTVWNTKESLGEVLKRAKRLETGSTATYRKPPVTTAAPISTMKEILGEKDSTVKALLAKLESLKVKAGGEVYGGLGGIAVATWNGAVNAVQLAIKAGQSIAQAVEAGIAYLKANHKGEFDEAEARRLLTVDAGGDLVARQHMVKALGDERIPESVKEKITNVFRTVLTDDEMRAGARAMMAEVEGNPAAAIGILMSRPMPGAQRIFLAAQIVRTFSEQVRQAEAANQAALADKLATQLAEFMNEFEAPAGTDAGQTLRAWREMHDALPARAYDKLYNSVLEKYGAKLRQQVGAVLGPVLTRFNLINAEGLAALYQDASVQAATRAAVDATLEAEAAKPGPLHEAVNEVVLAGLPVDEETRRKVGQAIKGEIPWSEVGDPQAAEVFQREHAKVRRTVKERAAKARKPGGLTSDTAIDRAIRRRLNELRLKLGKVAQEHWSQVDELGRDLATKLAEEAGLDPAAAQALAKRIEERFAELVRAKKRQALEKLTAGAKGAGRALGGGDVADKLIKASNVGALDEEQAFAAVAEKLGLPVQSAKVRKEIKQRAEAIQQLPEGSVQRLKATADLMRFIHDQAPIPLSDLAWGIYYANILSGMTTQAVNILSNTSSLVGSATAASRGNPVELARIIADIWKALPAGVREGKNVLVSGFNPRAEFKWERPVSALERDLKGWQRWLIGLRYVARSMQAADAVFYIAAREAKARSMARRRGVSLDTMDFTSQLDAEAAQMRSLGFEPDAAWRARREDQLREQARPGEIVNGSQEFAANATFNRPAYGIMGVLSNAINSASQWAEREAAKGGEMAPAYHAAAAVRRIVVPFTNIIANVVNEGLNYTPVGAGRAAWAGYQFRRNAQGATLLGQTYTADKAADLYSKAMLGTALMAGVLAAAVKGLDDDDQDFQLHGPGPTNADRKKALRDTGWVPYSIRLGGKYYSYANWVVGPGLAMMGQVLDAERYEGKKVANMDVAGKLAIVARAVPQVITQMSFLDSMARLAGWVERPGTSAKAGDELVAQLGRNASSFVPYAGANFFKQLDRLQDPTVYDAKGIEAALVAGVPFVRATGRPALNALGKPVENVLWNRIVSTEKEGLLHDLAKRNALPGMPNQGVLNDDQYYLLVKERGVLLERLLTARQRAIRDARSDAEAQRIVAQASTMATEAAKKRTGLARIEREAKRH